MDANGEISEIQKMIPEIIPKSGEALRRDEEKKGGMRAVKGQKPLSEMVLEMSCVRSSGLV